MVDPWDITNYQRTDEELEEFLLFCVLTANKPAGRMAKALNHLLSFGEENDPPFLVIRRMVFANELRQRLIEAGTGLYRARERTFTELCLNYAGMTLRNASIKDLETVFGIGSKTARLFVLHSRPHPYVAVLDTHILKYLRSIGVSDVPLSTPSTVTFSGIQTYNRLTDAFIRDAAKHGRTPAEHDLAVWTTFSRKGAVALYERSGKSTIGITQTPEQSITS